MCENSRSQQKCEIHSKEEEKKTWISFETLYIWHRYKFRVKWSLRVLMIWILWWFHCWPKINPSNLSTVCWMADAWTRHIEKKNATWYVRIGCIYRNKIFNGHSENRKTKKTTKIKFQTKSDLYFALAKYFLFFFIYMFEFSCIIRSVEHRKWL